MRIDLGIVADPGLRVFIERIDRYAATYTDGSDGDCAGHGERMRVAHRGNEDVSSSRNLCRIGERARVFADVGVRGAVADENRHCAADADESATAARSDSQVVFFCVRGDNYITRGVDIRPAVDVGERVGRNDRDVGARGHADSSARDCGDDAEPVQVVPRCHEDRLVRACAAGAVHYGVLGDECRCLIVDYVHAAAQVHRDGSGAASADADARKVILVHRRNRNAAHGCRGSGRGALARQLAVVDRILVRVLGQILSRPRRTG